MGKSAPRMPEAPDPTETAKAQGAVNVKTAIAQAKLNRFDEITPYGSSAWTQEAEVAEPFVPEYESRPIYGEKEWIDEGYGSGYWKEGGITGYEQVQTNVEPEPGDPLDRRWTRTTTLDPAQQAIYEKQAAVSGELGGVALDQVGRVGTALGEEFTYGGIAPGGSAAGARAAADRAAGFAAQPFNYDDQPAAPTADALTAAAARAAGSVASPFALSGSAPGTAGISGAADRAEQGMAQPFNYAGLPSSFDTQGAQAAVQAATGAYGTPFDYSGAPAAPGADAAARQQVIDSVYGQYASRLDPRFAGELQAMETKLANSGIARGTQAFSGAMDDFTRGRNDAYQSAQNAAIQAGGAEQSRLFGLGRSARQDAIAEQNYLRALPGAEQGQLLGYQGQLSGLMGQARGDAARERLTERGVPIDEATRLQALRGTAFGAESAARDRSVQEQLLTRGQPLREQRDLMGLQQAAFGAQGAQRAQSIQEALTQRAVPLAEQQQAFGMQQGLFGLDKTARESAIAERAYLRNLPLNETSALLSGTQINNPQFAPASMTGVANTDYAGLVANNYAQQVSQANAQRAANSATTGAMISGIGSIAGAAIY